MSGPLTASTVVFRPRSAKLSPYSHPSSALWAADVLVDKTANLKCPLALTDIAYSGVASLPPQPVSTDDDELPDWGIAIIVIALVLFFAVLLFAIMMYRAEKSGKPIFSSLTDVQVANAKPQA